MPRKPWKDLTREERHQRELAYYARLDKQREEKEAKQARKAERQAKRDTKQKAYDEKYQNKSYGWIGANSKTKLHEVSGKMEYNLDAYNRRGKPVGHGKAVGYDNYRKLRKRISSDRPIWIKFGGIKRKIPTEEQVNNHTQPKWKKI